MDFVNDGGVFSKGAYMNVGANWYYNAAFKYSVAGAATWYQQVAGAHNWFSAPAWNGSGSDALTFGDPKMVLDASGRLIRGGSTADTLTTDSATMVNLGNFAVQYAASTGTYLAIKPQAANGTVDISADARSGAYPALRFLTSSTSRMTLDSDGRLGLGVTPSAWAGTGGGYGIFQLGDTGCSIFGAGSGYSNSNYFYISNNAYFSNSFKYYRAKEAAQYVQFSNTHQWLISNNTPVADASITFTQAMTLDASGNLGVGATSPTRRLHIYDSTQAVGRYQQIIQGGAAGYGAGVSFQSFLDGTSTLAEMARITADGEDSWNSTASTQDAGLRLYTALDGTVSERIRVMPSGQTRFTANGTASAPTIANADNPDTGLYWPTDNDTLALAVGGSDAVYIDANRNVGFGATPSAPITVKSRSSDNLSIRILQSSGGAGNIQWTDDPVSAQWGAISVTSSAFSVVSNSVLTFSSNSTERLRIKSTGQINFSGLASAPTGAVGDLYYNSTSNTLQYHNNSAFQQISRKYSTALAGTNTSFTVTHNFGTRDVTVQVRKSGSTYDLVYTDVQMTTENAVTVIFASSVTGSDYTVTVIG